MYPQYRVVVHKVSMNLLAKKKKMFFQLTLVMYGSNRTGSKLAGWICWLDCFPLAHNIVHFWNHTDYYFKIILNPLTTKNSISS